MKARAFTALAAACLLLSCQHGDSVGPSVAAVEIRTRILSAQSKTLESTATTWDSLVVQACYDSDTVRRAIRLAAGATSTIDTVSGLPAGDVSVSVSTVSTSGAVVHTSSPQQTTLDPGQTASLSFWLIPACGSIYVSLADVPTSVSTVGACFTFAGDTLCSSAARATKVNLAIDYVPDGASGTLTIAALGTGGDTLYQSHTPLVFHTDRNTTVAASFSATPGGLALQTTVTQPGVTLVALSMGASAIPDSEYGPVIISEIMYNANYAEYVELHNPGAVDTSFDSIAVECDGSRRWLTNVSIPAGGFYVVARFDSAWADTFLTILDLSSTSGNWLTVRDKSLRVLDWVAFAAGANTLGWPYLGSSKASIVLDSLPDNPRYNNYGGNWAAAVSTIGASGLRGTPGTAGL